MEREDYRSPRLLARSSELPTQFRLRSLRNSYPNSIWVPPDRHPLTRFRIL